MRCGESRSLTSYLVLGHREGRGDARRTRKGEAGDQDQEEKQELNGPDFLAAKEARRAIPIDRKNRRGKHDDM